MVSNLNFLNDDLKSLSKNFALKQPLLRNESVFSEVLNSRKGSLRSNDEFEQILKQEFTKLGENNN